MYLDIRVPVFRFSCLFLVYVAAFLYVNIIIGIDMFVF